MPTFNDVEIEVTQKIDIDFEVYCNTCGAGLCGESDTRKSRNRGYLQVSVNVCPDCMKEKDEEIKNLQSEKDDLENQVYKLEQELEKMREYYNA
jgi:peptidoglycan hydrolase CwlO-like protein